MTNSEPENLVLDQGQQGKTPIAHIEARNTSPLQRLQREIRDALELMEFAIKNGRPLDDATIERIKQAENYLQATAQWPGYTERASFEKAYRDLAIFVKPITIDTLRATKDGYQGQSRSWFSRKLFSHSSDAKLFSKKLWTWVILCALLIVLAQTASDVYGS